MLSDMGIYNIAVWLIFFLLPGMLIIVFAQKMIEHNARAYPRIYGRAGKVIALLGIYSGAIFWIVLGFRVFILK